MKYVSVQFALNAIRSEIEDKNLKIKLVRQTASPVERIFKAEGLKYECIVPGDYQNLGLKPMNKESFATYWKFDFLNSLQESEIFIYIDLDAFIVRPLNLDFLFERIEAIKGLNANIDSGQSFRNRKHQNEKSILLMVPSHRPVFERMGYSAVSNPYAYYNAGFIVGTLFHTIQDQTIKSVAQRYYFNDSDKMFWHDQDLINSIFANEIFPLPYSYNISTGMLNKKYFGIDKLNVNVMKEFRNPIVIHASGGVLNTQRKYPYRKYLAKRYRDIEKEFAINSSNCVEIADFIEYLEESEIYKSFKNFWAVSRMNVFKICRRIRFERQ
jgi:lipopolysaccharide biosynthesis glycosyltransferase